MPTYIYEHITNEETTCNLGYQFDKFESITIEPLTHCEVCKIPVKRIISSGAGTIFKGDGFYENMYPKK